MEPINEFACVTDKRLLVLDGLVLDLVQRAERERGVQAIARRAGCDSVAEASEIQARAIDWCALRLASLRNALMEQIERDAEE
jgi:hypothetical protein